MPVNNTYEFDPNLEEPALPPWSFELVEGKCITYIEEVELTEEQWDELVTERAKFYLPTLLKRQQEREVAEKAKRDAELKAREVRHTFDGVEFVGYGPNVESLHASGGDKPSDWKIELRKSNYGANTSRWVSKPLKEPRWYAWVFWTDATKVSYRRGGQVKGESGNVVSYKTVEAAGANAVKHLREVSRGKYPDAS